MMHKTAIFKIFFACLIAGPLIVYGWKFGYAISSAHTRWSEFGSFISGIYSPILTAISIALLTKQYQLQNFANEQQHDQAIIQQARSDIDFYIEQLRVLMSEKAPDAKTVRDVLHTNFQPNNVLLLDDKKMRELAIDLDAKHPSILLLLFAIQSTLGMLASNERAIFRINYTSSMQRMMASLTFETCVSLENYHRARTEGRLKSKYRFSPLLTSE